MISFFLQASLSIAPIGTDYLVFDENSQNNIIKIINNSARQVSIEQNDINQINITDITSSSVLMSIRMVSKILNMEFNANNELVIPLPVINKKITLKGFSDVFIQSIENERITLKINNRDVVFHIKADSVLTYNNTDQTFKFEEGSKILMFKNLTEGSFGINNIEVPLTTSDKLVVNVGNKYRIMTDEPILGIYNEGNITLFNNTFKNFKVLGIDDTTGLSIYKEGNNFIYSIGGYNAVIDSDSSVKCSNTMRYFSKNDQLTDLLKIDTIQIKDFDKIDKIIQHKGQVTTLSLKNLDGSIINLTIKDGDIIYPSMPKLFFNGTYEGICITPSGTNDIFFPKENITFKDILKTPGVKYDISITTSGDFLINNHKVLAKTIIISKTDDVANNDIEVRSKETGEIIDIPNNLLIYQSYDDKNVKTTIAVFDNKKITIKPQKENKMVILHSFDNKCFIKSIDDTENLCVVPFINNLIVEYIPNNTFIENIFGPDDKTKINIDASFIFYITQNQCFTIFNKYVPYGLKIIKEDKIMDFYEITPTEFVVNQEHKYTLSNKTVDFQVFNPNGITSVDILALIHNQSADHIAKIRNINFINGHFIYKNDNDLIVCGKKTSNYMTLYNYFQNYEAYDGTEYNFNTSVLKDNINNRTFNVYNRIYIINGLTDYFKKKIELWETPLTKGKFNFQINIGEFAAFFVEEKDDDVYIFTNTDFTSYIVLSKFLTKELTNIELNLTTGYVCGNNSCLHINFTDPAFQKLILVNKPTIFNKDNATYNINPNYEGIIAISFDSLPNKASIITSDFKKGVTINFSTSSTATKPNIIIDKESIKIDSFIITQDQAEYFPALTHTIVDNKVPIALVNKNQDALLLFNNGQKQTILKFFNNDPSPYSQSYFKITEDNKIQLSDITDPFDNYDVVFPLNTNITNNNLSCSLLGQFNNNNLIIKNINYETNNFANNIILYNYRNNSSLIFSLTIENNKIKVNNQEVDTDVIFAPYNLNNTLFEIKDDTTPSVIYKIIYKQDTIFFHDKTEKILHINSKNKDGVQLINFSNLNCYTNQPILVFSKMVIVNGISLYYNKDNDSNYSVLFFPNGSYTYKSISLDNTDSFSISKYCDGATNYGTLVSEHFKEVILPDFFLDTSLYTSIKVDQKTIVINNITLDGNTNEELLNWVIFGVGNLSNTNINNIKFTSVDTNQFFLYRSGNNMKIKSQIIPDVQTIYNGFALESLNTSAGDITVKTNQAPQLSLSYILIDKEYQIDNINQSVEYQKGLNIINGTPLFLEKNLICKTQDNITQFIDSHTNISCVGLCSSRDFYTNMNILGYIQNKLNTYFPLETETNYFILFPAKQQIYSFIYKNLTINVNRCKELIIYDNPNEEYIYIYDTENQPLKIPFSRIDSQIIECNFSNIIINQNIVIDASIDDVILIPNNNTSVTFHTKNIIVDEPDSTFKMAYVLKQTNDFVIPHLEITVKGFNNTDINALKIKKNEIHINNEVFANNFKGYCIDCNCHTMSDYFSVITSDTLTYLVYKQKNLDIIFFIKGQSNDLTNFITLKGFYNIDNTVNTYYDGHTEIDITNKNIKINGETFSFYDKSAIEQDLCDLFPLTYYPKVNQNNLINVLNIANVYTDCALIVEEIQANNITNVRFFTSVLTYCPVIPNFTEIYNQKFIISNTSEKISLYLNKDEIIDFDFVDLLEFTGVDICIPDTTQPTKTLKIENTTMPFFVSCFYSLQDQDLCLPNVCVKLWQDLSTTISSIKYSYDSITINVGGKIYTTPLMNNVITDVYTKSISIDNGDTPFYITNNLGCVFLRNEDANCLTIVGSNNKKNCICYDFYSNGVFSNKYSALIIDADGTIKFNNITVDTTTKERICLPKNSSYKDIFVNCNAVVTENKDNIELVCYKTPTSKVTVYVQNSPENNITNTNQLKLEFDATPSIFKINNSEYQMIDSVFYYINSLKSNYSLVPFNINLSDLIYFYLKSVELTIKLSGDDLILLNYGITIDKSALDQIKNSNYCIKIEGTMISIVNRFNEKLLMKAFIQKDMSIVFDNNRFIAKIKIQGVTDTNIFGEISGEDIIIRKKGTNLENTIKLSNCLDLSNIVFSDDSITSNKLSIKINSLPVNGENAIFYLSNSDRFDVLTIYNEAQNATILKYKLTSDIKQVILPNTKSINDTFFSGNNKIVINNSGFSCNGLTTQKDSIFFKPGSYSYKDITIDTTKSYIMYDSVDSCILKNSSTLTNITLYGDSISDLNKYKGLCISDTKLSINDLNVTEDNVIICPPSVDLNTDYDLKDNNSILKIISDTFFQVLLDAINITISSPGIPNDIILTKTNYFASSNYKKLKIESGNIDEIDSANNITNIHTRSTIAKPPIIISREISQYVRKIFKNDKIIFNGKSITLTGDKPYIYASITSDQNELIICVPGIQTYILEKTQITDNCTLDITSNVVSLTDSSSNQILPTIISTDMLFSINITGNTDIELGDRVTTITGADSKTCRISLNSLDLSNDNTCIKLENITDDKVVFFKINSFLVARNFDFTEMPAILKDMNLFYNSSGLWFFYSNQKIQNTSGSVIVSSYTVNINNPNNINYLISSNNIVVQKANSLQYWKIDQDGLTLTIDSYIKGGVMTKDSSVINATETRSAQFVFRVPANSTDFNIKNQTADTKLIGFNGFDNNSVLYDSAVLYDNFTHPFLLVSDFLKPDSMIVINSSTNQITLEKIVGGNTVESYSYVRRESLDTDEITWPSPIISTTISKITNIKYDSDLFFVNNNMLGNTKFYCLNFYNNSKYNNFIFSTTFENIVTTLFKHGTENWYTASDYSVSSTDLINKFYYIPPNDFTKNYTIKPDNFDELSFCVEKNTELCINTINETGIDQYYVVYNPTNMKHGLKIKKNINPNGLIFGTSSLNIGGNVCQYVNIDNLELYSNGTTISLSSCSININDTDSNWPGAILKQDGDNLIIMNNNITIKNFNTLSSIQIQKNSIIINSKSYNTEDINGFTIDHNATDNKLIIYKQVGLDLHFKFSNDDKINIFKNFFTSAGGTNTYYSNVTYDATNNQITVNNINYQLYITEQTTPIKIENLTFYPAKETNFTIPNTNLIVTTDKPFIVFQEKVNDKINCAIFTEGLQKSVLFKDVANVSILINLNDATSTIKIENMSFLYSEINNSKLILKTNVITQDGTYEFKTKDISLYWIDNAKNNISICSKDSFIITIYDKFFKCGIDGNQYEYNNININQTNQNTHILTSENQMFINNEVNELTKQKMIVTYKLNSNNQLIVNLDEYYSLELNDFELDGNINPQYFVSNSRIILGNANKTEDVSINNINIPLSLIDNTGGIFEYYPANTTKTSSLCVKTNFPIIKNFGRMFAVLGNNLLPQLSLINCGTNIINLTYSDNTLTIEDTDIINPQNTTYYIFQEGDNCDDFTPCPIKIIIDNDNSYASPIVVAYNEITDSLFLPKYNFSISHEVLEFIRSSGCVLVLGIVSNAETSILISKEAETYINDMNFYYKLSKSQTNIASTDQIMKVIFDPYKCENILLYKNHDNEYQLSNMLCSFDLISFNPTLTSFADNYGTGFTKEDVLIGKDTNDDCFMFIKNKLYKIENKELLYTFSPKSLTSININGPGTTTINKNESVLISTENNKCQILMPNHTLDLYYSNLNVMNNIDITNNLFFLNAKGHNMISIGAGKFTITHTDKTFTYTISTDTDSICYADIKLGSSVDIQYFVELTIYHIQSDNTVYALPKIILTEPDGVATKNIKFTSSKIEFYDGETLSYTLNIKELANHGQIESSYFVCTNLTNIPTEIAIPLNLVISGLTIPILYNTNNGNLNLLIYNASITFDQFKTQYNDNKFRSISFSTNSFSVDSNNIFNGLKKYDAPNIDFVIEPNKFLRICQASYEFNNNTCFDKILSNKIFIIDHINNNKDMILYNSNINKGFKIQNINDFDHVSAFYTDNASAANLREKETTTVKLLFKTKYNLNLSSTNIILQRTIYDLENTVVDTQNDIYPYADVSTIFPINTSSGTTIDYHNNNKSSILKYTNNTNNVKSNSVLCPIGILGTQNVLILCCNGYYFKKTFLANENLDVYANVIHKFYIYNGLADRVPNLQESLLEKVPSFNINNNGVNTSWNVYDGSNRVLSYKLDGSSNTGSFLTSFKNGQDNIFAASSVVLFKSGPIDSKFINKPDLYYKVNKSLYMICIQNGKLQQPVILPDFFSNTGVDDWAIDAYYNTQIDFDKTNFKLILNSETFILTNLQQSKYLYQKVNTMSTDLNAKFNIAGMLEFDSNSRFSILLGLSTGAPDILSSIKWNGQLPLKGSASILEIQATGIKFFSTMSRNIFTMIPFANYKKIYFKPSGGYISNSIKIDSTLNGLFFAKLSDCDVSISPLCTNFNFLHSYPNIKQEEALLILMDDDNLLFVPEKLDNTQVLLHLNDNKDYINIKYENTRAQSVLFGSKNIFLLFESKDVKKINFFDGSNISHQVTCNPCYYSQACLLNIKTFDTCLYYNDGKIYKVSLFEKPMALSLVRDLANSLKINTITLNGSDVYKTNIECRNFTDICLAKDTSGNIYCHDMNYQNIVKNDQLLDDVPLDFFNYTLYLLKNTPLSDLNGNLYDSYYELFVVFDPIVYGFEEIAD